MPDIPVTIQPGFYYLDMECPQCGLSQPALVLLGCRLTVDSDAEAALRARMTTKAVPHICNQPALIRGAETGTDQPTLED